MGIPSYFRAITSTNPDIIVNQKLANIKSFYLDFNGAIHGCCRKVIDQGYTKRKKLQFEKRMITECIEYLDKMVEYVNPSQLVYIAIDGPAPRAKMTQQRIRRFKSVKERQTIHQIKQELGIEEQLEDKWDTNAITPGTMFMKKLADAIKYHIRTGRNPQLSQLKVIISDSNIPGEGEHKILAHIKEDNVNQGNEEELSEGKIIIYGLDADLIMLSMASHVNYIYLLREALEFGKNYFESGYKFLYLDIDTFKGCLIAQITKQLGFRLPNISDELKFIDDYIFICFIMGNDFLPHLPSISIKSGGIDILMEIYCGLYREFKENLIDVERKKINHRLLLDLFDRVRVKENYLMIQQHKRRLRLKPRTRDCETQLDVRLAVLNSLPIIDLSEEKDINPFQKGWRYRYYEKGFRMRSIPPNIRKVCVNYCEGLIWVFNYYYYGCMSWSWFYRYSHGPTLADIYYYLESLKDINHLKRQIRKGRPYKPFQQLLMVLPSESGHLLPRSYQKLMTDPESPLIEYFPMDYELDTLYKRYYWQCTPILPIINFTNIVEASRGAHINKYDKERNKLGKANVYMPQ